MLERGPVRLTVLADRRLPDADLVHPCLWPAAAVFARWRGLETLHGGAFVDDRGDAWAVLGDRGAGKSSLLAALALAGREVVADDLLVLDAGECFAGPRCVDLRPDAVHDGGLDALALVRSTRRRRLVLAPCDGRFTLRGCVYLEWGERVEVEPLAPGEHLGMLTGHRRVAGLGANVEQLMELSGLPAFLLRRPRTTESAQHAHVALLEALSRANSYFLPPFVPVADIDFVVGASGRPAIPMLRSERGRAYVRRNLVALLTVGAALALAIPAAARTPKAHRSNRPSLRMGGHVVG